MKKDIEWLKKSVKSMFPSHVPGYDFEMIPKNDVYRLIDQLEEPEITEEQAWEMLGSKYGDNGLLQENIAYVESQGYSVAEKVVIPEFVAEWIKNHDSFVSAFSIYDEFRMSPEEEKLYDWLNSNNNAELFARAWLAYPNVEVEKEKRYRVSSKMADTGGFWFLSKNNDGNIEVGTNEDYFEYGWDATKLTEQEIKDYDERYWPFAVPVEEVPQ